MRKETFKTKLTKRQKRNDILVILGVLIFAYIFTLWFSYAIGAFGDWPLSEILLIGLIVSPLVISLLKLPVIFAAIALGIQRGRARRVREDATFVSVQNMEYYRDNLKELNPALVSLVIDLDIYEKNDIVASLLRMQNKKVIFMKENGRIGVNADNIDQLDAGERELLEMVNNNKLNSKTSLSSWKENRFREAEELGYIRKKDVKNKKDPTKWAIILLVCFFIGLYVWAAFLPTIGRVDIGALFIRALIYLPISDILMFVPMYCLIIEVAKGSRKDVLWERTELGNETAEKIAALRRFIRDFSMLSTAEKEEALLWEDYLVYTIVLEDNEKIVKEISKQFGINLRNFGRIQRKET